MAGLFRPEALQYATERTFGAVVLRNSRHYTLSAMIVLLSALALIGLVYCGTYSETVSISGSLVPAFGIIDIHAPVSGVVLDIAAPTGDRVHVGDTLFKLRPVTPYRCDPATPATSKGGTQSATSVTDENTNVATSEKSNLQSVKHSGDSIQFNEQPRPSAAGDMDGCTISIRSSQTGTVIAPSLIAGTAVSAGDILTGVIPTSALLVGEAYVDAKTVAILHAGQHVIVRYLSFPYERDGQFHAVVSDVSDLPVAVTPDGSRPTEARYRVRLSLESQSIQGNSMNASLHIGMPFDAKIIVETRRIYQWLVFKQS
jgi:multidrug resistance efflux pump